MPSKSSERWHAEQLLRHFGIPPSSLVERECPDFQFAHDGKTVGLEVTRAVYREIVRAGKLHDKYCPNEIIDITHLKDGEKRRSNEEILRDMRALDPRALDAWESMEEGMLSWKARIGHSLVTKLDKLNQPNWRVFDKNWLLICDEPPMPVYPCDVDSALSHLRALLREQPRRARDFDAVFVSSCLYIFEWREGKLCVARTHGNRDKGEAQDWEQLVNKAQRESNHDNGEKVEAQE